MLGTSNKVLSVLTELVVADAAVGAALAAWPPLLPRLFALMPNAPLLDGAVSLAQARFPKLGFRLRAA